MNLLPIFSVVLVQILVFQFLSIRFSHALADHLFGLSAAPDPIEMEIKRQKRRAALVRCAVGMMLAVAAAAFMFFVPAETGPRKLGLAAVSILSSIAFVAGMVVDRRKIDAIAARLPDPTFRGASMERRSLRRYYHPLWELIPIGIFVATVLLTISAAGMAGFAEATPFSGVGDPRLWVLPGLQMIFLVAMFLQMMSRAIGADCVMPRSHATKLNLEASLALEERLRRIQIRDNLWTKSGMALLFGLLQARRIAPAVSTISDNLLSMLVWGTVLALLLTFAAYIVKTGRARRDVASQIARLFQSSDRKES